ncbi:protein-disulfide reductase DsbD, partial [Methylibium sp.]
MEIVFKVTDGYYLYREQFAFAAEPPAARLGAAVIPAGKVKFDETFGKDVETHRGSLTIRLPVEDAPAGFALNVTSQGCADKGLCYPPMTHAAEVRLAGFGGDGTVRVMTLGGTAVAADMATGTLDGRAVDAATAPAAPAPDASAPRLGSSGDASIDGALRSGRYWIVVGAFFLAGVLLSFTPCVLPMLPILSSIIVGAGRKGGAVSRSRGLSLSIVYSLGMALVYTLLGVAAGLAGEGLAAALQTPWVLGVFAAMLAALAMSMFGFYELQLPAAWSSGVSSGTNRLPGGHALGVFAMGGLSALIVSPCVAAPLAGALIYISQTRDVLLGGSALFSLAAGMSVPLLLVGASAGSLLPRAGAWMEGVKRGFGVLLLAVAWWILSPVLPAPLAVAGWGAVLLCAATFLFVFDRLPERAGAALRLGKTAGLVLAIAGALQLVGAAAGASDPLRPLAPLASRAGGDAAGAQARPGAHEGPRFTRVRTVAELDAALAASGRPVLLDFYADWCVSCKEMERFTFADPRVRAKLDKAVLLQVDVTANSAQDRALLKRFGLFGPPGIVFFDAGGRELGSLRVIG